MFILGVFIGGAIGIFLTSALTVGKISDLQNELELQKEKLKFRMYGKNSKKEAKP